MSMRVIIDGELTEVYPGIDVGGLPIIEDGLPVYVTPGGVPIRVDLTHVTVCAASHGSPERLEDAAPHDSPKPRADDPAPHGPPERLPEELWPETQLAEVLERQHLINPVYVAGAGRRRVQSAQSAAPCPPTPAAQSSLPSTSTASEDAAEVRLASPLPPISAALEAEQPEEHQEEQQQERQQQGPPAKRQRQDPNRALIEGFLNYLKTAEENRERRHNERIEAEERHHQENLAVARRLASSLEQQQQQPFPDDD